MSAGALDEGLKGVLKDPRGVDLAIGVKGLRQSFVVVFLRQASGSYLAVDVSQVEQNNIGVIGSGRSYRDVDTLPTGWLPPEPDDAVRIWMQTWAWDMTGQRYGTKEPLLITREGRPGWR